MDCAKCPTKLACTPALQIQCGKNPNYEQPATVKEPEILPIVPKVIGKARYVSQRDADMAKLRKAYKDMADWLEGLNPDYPYSVSGFYEKVETKLAELRQKAGE